MESYFIIIIKAYCDELLMRYDPAGRLVATQDVNQRKRSAWTLYMFDELGREALTATAYFTDAEINAFASRINPVRYVGNTELAGYEPKYEICLSLIVQSAEYYDDYRFSSMCPTLRPDGETAGTLRTTALGHRTGVGYSGGEPYETPFQAFTNYMNALSDFIVRVEEQYPMEIDNEDLNSLLSDHLRL